MIHLKYRLCLEYPYVTSPNVSLRHRWLAMASLFLAAFINLIDVTIVNVALPSIRAGLQATDAQVEWIAAAYILTFAIGLLPFGRFGDLWGRRRLFLIGLSGFAVTSTLCGLAPTIDSLIVARAFQGACGAMMVPQVLAIVHVIFPSEEKGRVIGIFGAVMSLGSVAGPLIGGLLIAMDIGGMTWRPIFLINLPLAVASLCGVMRWVAKSPIETKQSPDWGGAILLAVLVFCLVFPLIEGRSFGWPWWSFVLLGCVVPLAMAFATIEQRRARSGHSQLINITLLRNRDFLAGLGMITLFFSGIPGLFMVLALCLQSGLGLSALESGLTTAPFPIGVMIASTFSGRFGLRHIRPRLLVGAVLLCAGMSMLHLAVQISDTSNLSVLLIAPLLTCGLGMGASTSALFVSILDGVDKSEAGTGAGALQAFQQIGSAMGIAIVGQIFFAALSSEQPQAVNYVFASRQAVLYPIAVYAVLTVVTALRFLNRRFRQQQG